MSLAGKVVSVYRLPRITLTKTGEDDATRGSLGVILFLLFWAIVNFVLDQIPQEEIGKLERIVASFQDG